MGRRLVRGQLYDLCRLCDFQIRDDPLKLSLVLKAGSPMILLPVSSKSSDLLIVDLGQLLVTNSFKLSGDADTISVPLSDGSVSHVHSINLTILL